jgi:enediyne biosynthesis protein E5
MGRDETAVTSPGLLPVVPIVSGWRRFDNRFLAPMLITGILLAAQVSFGILEGWERTAVSIAMAIGAEMVMGRITYGTWPHPASAYISGISAGILIRSPFLWPYILTSLISITSKYVLRVRGRHLWNPTNFGVSAVVFLAPATVSVLSIQWGNVIAPMVLIWLLGAVIVWRVGRLHISATYVACFLALSVVRSVATGTPWLATVAPITGPMYQLFIFFMVTDPKTTVRSTRGQCVVVAMVAVVETLLRLNEVVYAPFYALFLVGPTALLVEAWFEKDSGRVRRMWRNLKPAAHWTSVWALVLLLVGVRAEAQVSLVDAQPSSDMTFFITSRGRGFGANLGGLQGADAHCQQLADAVGHGRHGWRAYLSAPAANGQPAVHARDRIGKGPWVNARGVHVAGDIDALHGDENALDRETSLSEKGTVIAPGRHDILTGSNPDGTFASGPGDTTCGGWTSYDAGRAMLGHHNRTGGGTRPRSWNSAHLSRGCSQALLRASFGDGLLYCFAAD